MSNSDSDLLQIVDAAQILTEPRERAAYLDRACAGDAALRARVEVLLAAHSGTGGLLDPNATGAFDATGPGVPDETGAFTPDPRAASIATGEFRPTDATRTFTPADPNLTTGLEIPSPEIASASGEVIGTVIAGRYTLVGTIGEGGMGSVYLAEQTAPVKRQVALKLIKAGMDSKSVLARFDAERQALALMDHPSIARIYDGGVTEHGQPFFVMELVQGTPLSEYCDRNKLSVDARLELFVSVCQAIQHAHQKGIIHRDLKPGNVLVATVDGRPTPKVIDFGVAKATEQKLTDMTFSDAGAIVGTPAYMSPEQADPASMDIDTRSDVYALGVILYELLTGTPPIDAKQFQRGALVEMLRMVREVDPPRPSIRLSTAEALPKIAANRDIDPAKLTKLLQGELDWIVLKALEKDRSRRYESALGFAQDVQRYLADEVVEARPPSRSYRLRKFVKRNKVQVTAAALVFLALIAGVVGTSFGMIRAEDQHADAVKARDGEKNQREKAEGLADANGKLAVREGELKVKAEELALKNGNLAVSNAKLAADEAKAKDEALDANREKDRQIERQGALLITVQMEKAARLRDTDPAAALNVLYDMNAIPIDKRDMAWNFTVNTYNRFRATSFAVPTSFGSALSPDAKVLALARFVDGPQGPVGSFVAFLDLATGKVRATTETFPARIGRFAFSPDSSKLVLTVDPFPLPKGAKPDEKPIDSGKIQVHDAADPQKVVTLKGHTDRVLVLAFSPDGTRLASGSADKAVRVWNLKTGQQLHVIKDHGAEVGGVTFTADGKYLATGGMDNIIRLWSADGFKLLNTWTPTGAKKTDGVTVLESSPDGKTLLSGSASGLIESRDIATGYVHWRNTKIQGRIAWLRFHRDGKSFFWRTTLLSRWNAENGTRFPGLIPGEFHQPRSLVVDIQGSRCDILDLDAPLERATLRAESKGGGGISVFSRDGKMLAVASGDRILVWDVGNGQLRHTLSGHKTSVAQLAPGPDARTLISSSVETGLGEVRVWNLETGESLWAGPIGERFNGGFVASPDGTTLVALRPVVADKKGTNKAFAMVANETLATVWDVQTRRVRFEMKLSRGAQIAALNPIDSTLVTHTGSVISVWDLHTKKLVREIMYPSQKGVPRNQKILLRTMAINPDGKTVVALHSQFGQFGQPKTTELFVWDLKTGARVNHERSGTSVRLGDNLAFSTDGKTLLMGELRTVHFLDTVTYRNRTSFAISEPREAWAPGIAVSPTGELIATIRPSQVQGTVEVKLCDVSRPETVVVLPNRGLMSPKFSPDSKFLLSVMPGGDVTGWDLSTGRVRNWHDPELDRFKSAIRTPDGRYVLTPTGIGFSYVVRGNDDPIAKTRAAIQVLDIRTNTTRGVEVGVGGIRTVAFSPDGATTAFVHMSTAEGMLNLRYSVKVLRLADGTITGTYPVGGGPLAFAPDGNTLAAGTTDGKIFLINLSKGTVSEPLKAGTSLDEDRRKNVAAIRFTKDGTRLVVALGVADQTLTMWDWRAGKPVTNEPIPDLFAKPDPYLSPDGRYRIRRSGPGSGTVEVIDLTAKPPEVVSQRRVP